ncbi:hypothetical protein FA95DRAFT_790933 [Auriscalpium vulgare]|uniref:Uncharacterized protein n=1 Tax=Auriscalpium vulgare TaxID=40419 RepID=A0ACB8RBD0_9AGAM|nr:hypothetical protein FA95DRAFT_790933 [Auriscalpium vulgare]
MYGCEEFTSMLRLLEDKAKDSCELCMRRAQLCRAWSTCCSSRPMSSIATHSRPIRQDIFSNHTSMTTVQDPGHDLQAREMPDAPNPQRSGTGAPIGDVQGQIAPQRRTDEVRVIVIRAQGLPSLKNAVGQRRKFFLTVSDGATVKTTKAAAKDGEYVTWNAVLDGFALDPSSHLTLRVFAKRLRKDMPVATLVLSLESIRSSVQNDTDFDLVMHASGSGLAKLRLLLSISRLDSTNAKDTLGANADPQLTISSDPDTHSPSPAKTPAGEISSDLSTADLVQSADSALSGAKQAVEHMSGLSKHAITTMELVDNSPGAVDKVKDIYDTWKSTVDKIQWAMALVDGIAEIHPFVKTAWTLFAVIPKAFLDQVQLDRSIQQLLSTIHDTLELLQEAQTLKIIQDSQSKQTDIFITMLKLICSCGGLIQAYAAEDKLWKRAWSNALSSADQQITEYSNTLALLKMSFMDYTILQTQTASQTALNMIKRTSEELNELSKQVKELGGTFSLVCSSD